MKKLHISEQFLQNLATLKGINKFIDDVINVPGLNFFMGLLAYLQQGAEDLDFEVLKKLEGFLITEFLGSNSKIKNVIGTFLKIKCQRDKNFKERVNF